MFLIFLIVLGIIGLIPVITKKPFIWFPSFSSWLKALMLAIPTWICAVVFVSLFGWLCFGMLIFAIVTRSPLDAIGGMALLSSLFLLGSLFWYLLLAALYSVVLRLLWSEVPNFLRWLELPKKRRDVLFGWIASTLAVGIGVTPIVVFVFLSFENDFTVYSLRYDQELVSQVIVKRLESLTDEMFVAWFVVCAYLYQIKSVYVHKTAKKRMAKQSRA